VALSRSARLADWQFDQALQSARILACDLLNLPWTSPLHPSNRSGE
jgi:hypothetical protein